MEYPYNARIFFVLDNGIRQHKTPITYNAALSLANQINGWGGNASIVAGTQFAL